MKETTKKRLKKVGIGAGFFLGVVTVGTFGYVLGYKPKDGIPCSRSVMRADGVPKKAFDSAIRANCQSVIQFVFHGEICRPYKIGNKFYTGHIKRA